MFAVCLKSTRKQGELSRPSSVLLDHIAQLLDKLSLCPSSTSAKGARAAFCQEQSWLAEVVQQLATQPGASLSSQMD